MWAWEIPWLAACSLVVAGAALAPRAGERPKVATGLWEIRIMSQMSGAGLPANLPPHETSFRTCATEQTIAESFASAENEQNADCVRSNEKMTSSEVSLDFSCGQEGEKSQGHFSVVFDSDTVAHTTMHMTGNMRGRVIEASSTGTAKWLKSDCGSVVPGHAEMVR